MSVLTEVLKLFKYDPATDGDMTFNIGQCMNDNWDKLDAAILLAIAAAGAYNPEESYAVGDYCTYKGKLHKCSTAIPTGETWTEAHWTTTTVAAELAELSSQLSNLESTLTTPPQTYSVPLAEGWSGIGQYSKTQDGVVILNLNLDLDDDGTCADNSVVGTLPVGFRVAPSRLFAVSIQQSDTRFSAVIQVGANGAITYFGSEATTRPFRIYGGAVFVATA